MTVHLLSPSIVRNRADDVSYAAGVGFAVLIAGAIILGMFGYLRTGATLAAMASACAGVSIGAQLVARRVR